MLDPQLDKSWYATEVRNATYVPYTTASGLQIGRYYEPRKAVSMSEDEERLQMALIGGGAKPLSLSITQTLGVIITCLLAAFAVVSFTKH